MKVCKRCVMDTTDPKILFDSRGYCNHCNEWFSQVDRVIHAKNDLEILFDELKEKRKSYEYDGIIGVSGGLDSSYTTFLAYQHGLNCLLVHFDNGYNAPEGDHNVQAIKKATGWDLIINSMDLDEFHDLQLAYLKAGVKNLEVLSDHAIRSNLFDTLMETDIKHIIKGNNWVTEGILPSSWGYRHSDLANIKDIHSKYGTKPLKTYPQMSVLESAYRIRIRGITEVKPLNHIDYNVKEAKRTLVDEWGWRDYGWKHFESIITRFYQAYILPYRWGHDKRKAHLSTLICSDQISRDDALKILEDPPYPYPGMRDDREYIVDQLGIPDEKFQRYLDSPRQNHTNFKTNTRTLNTLRFLRNMGSLI